MSYCHLGRPLIPPYFKSSKNLILNPPSDPKKSLFQAPRKTLFKTSKNHIPIPRNLIKKPPNNPISIPNYKSQKLKFKV
jgi:hypothetical protein